MGPTQANSLGRERFERNGQFFATLPAYRHLRDLLSDGSSVVLYGPRHFELDAMALRALDHAIDQGQPKCIVRLTADTALPSGGLDFSVLWDSVARSLGARARSKVTDEIDFVDAVRKALDRCGKPLIAFILRSGGRDSTARFRELIDAIHQLVDEPEHPRSAGRCLFVAIDDYLLHYFVQGGELHSEWFRARWVEAPHLSQDDIADCIARLTPQESHEPSAVEMAARTMFAATGGHVGLLLELIEWANGMQIDLLSFAEPPIGERAQRQVQASVTLQAIRSAIDNDTLGLCATALEHRTARMPLEYRSPRIQILRQLGILTWERTVDARLCDGPLGRMVEAVATRQSAPRLGTVASVSGMTRFEEEAFHPDDDDICVLHISDLHFGADFGYRLNIGGRAINADRLSIGNLIASDLKAQNLERRIDAVVISGDIACMGVAEEYYRAAEVIQELLSLLGLDNSRLCVVPGNHDMRWNPGALARQDGNRDVSREDFDVFYERVCGRRLAAADLVRVVSRGGKAALAIVSLDSNEVESQEAAGIGFVGEDCLRGASKLIEDLGEERDPPHLWFVLHHHLTPVTSAVASDARRKAVSVLANAPAVLQLVRDTHAEVILHGHEHQPSITELKWWLGERQSVFGSVASICAGSLSAKRERLGPVSRNQYMILVRRRNELIVRSRLMGDEGIAFQAHEDIAVPLPATTRGELLAAKSRHHS